MTCEAYESECICDISTNDESVNPGHVVSDDVWARVVQLIQLSMLTATDVTDLIRTIKVRFDPATSQHVLGDGQNEAFERQVKDLVEKVDRLRVE